MKIVEGYDMRSPSALNLSTHYLDEGMRFAYGQRTLLGDPTFSPNLTVSYIHLFLLRMLLGTDSLFFASEI